MLYNLLFINLCIFRTYFIKILYFLIKYYNRTNMINFIKPHLIYICFNLYIIVNYFYYFLKIKILLLL